MAKALSLSEVKTRLPELVTGVQEREEEVVVTKNGRPAAVLINVDEYTRLKETLDVLSDPVLMIQIGRSKSFYRTGRKSFTFEDVFGEPLTPREETSHCVNPFRPDIPPHCGGSDSLSPP